MKRAIGVVLLSLLVLLAFGAAEAEGQLYLPRDLTEIGAQAFENTGDYTYVYIPYGVASIGERAFAGSSLTSVYIPDSVVSIGKQAFADSALQELLIPESVQEIGAEAFDGLDSDAVISVYYGSPAYYALKNADLSCTLNVIGAPDEYAWSYLNYEEERLSDGRLLVRIKGMKPFLVYDLVIPPTLQGSEIDEIRIEDNAFENWAANSADPYSLTLPDCVTRIGNRAFYGCYCLQGQLHLPSRLESIGDEAFASCGLTGSLQLPETLTSIGKKAFEYCDGLSGELVLPSGITRIEESAFMKCSGLTALQLPAGLEAIGDYAFNQCSGLSGSLSIPSSVTQIGKSAFNGCGGLTGNLIIPDSVLTIGERAFSGCSFGGTLTLSSALSRLENGVFYDDPFTGGLTLPGGLTHIGAEVFQGAHFTGALNIPSGVAAIGNHAFDGNGFSGALQLPAALTSIGGYAFRGISGLSGSLYIPNRVTGIGEYAFAGCTGFTGTLTFGNRLQRIGKYAFSELNFSGALTLPESLTDLGAFAFSKCPNLTGVTVPSRLGRGSEEIPEQEYRFDEADWFEGSFAYCTGLESVTFRDGLKRIPNSMFSECTGLRRVKLPDTVELISRSAFYECTNLIWIDFPTTIKYIQSFAFYNCSNLRGVIDLSGVENFYAGYSGSLRQFYGCTGLSGAILSGTAFDNDDWPYTFEECSADFTVYCPEGSDTAWKCSRHGIRCEYIYSDGLSGALPEKTYPLGEPLNLNGFYRSDVTISMLRASVYTAEDYELVKRAETEVGGKIAYFSALNDLLGVEDLPVGNYQMEIEVLLNGKTEYLLVGYSSFRITKTIARAWVSDDYRVPSGIYPQGRIFTPGGSVRMNRYVDRITVSVTGQDGYPHFTKTLEGSVNQVSVAEALDGFEMQRLEPGLYNYEMNIFLGEEELPLAGSAFRIYSYSGALGENTVQTIIRFCQDGNNRSVFYPYRDYVDNMSDIGFKDGAAMLVCNFQDIVVDNVLGFLSGESGDGHVKELYKQYFLKIMRSFEEDYEDPPELGSFEKLVESTLKDDTKTVGFAVDYANNQMEDLFVQYCLDIYGENYQSQLETIEKTDPMYRVYKDEIDYLDGVKDNLKRVGSVIKIEKYTMQAIGIFSDAMQDHEKGLRAIASLLDAYGDDPPAEVREALDEIMMEYQNMGIQILTQSFNAIINEAYNEAYGEIEDFVVEALVGESNVLTYKVSRFVLDKSLELTGVQDLAKKDYDFLTMMNLAIQTHSNYRDAFDKVNAGDSTTDSINNVYYTFEATKSILKDLYELMIRDEDPASDRRAWLQEQLVEIRNLSIR